MLRSCIPRFAVFFNLFYTSNHNGTQSHTQCILAIISFICSHCNWISTSAKVSEPVLGLPRHLGITLIKIKTQGAIWRPFDGSQIESWLILLGPPPSNEIELKYKYCEASPLIIPSVGIPCFHDSPLAQFICQNNVLFPVGSCDTAAADCRHGH